MIFPAINLWSIPHQDLYNYILRDKNINSIINTLEAEAEELRGNRIKELEFLYYTRSGKFPGDK